MGIANELRGEGLFKSGPKKRIRKRKCLEIRNRGKNKSLKGVRAWREGGFSELFTLYKSVEKIVYKIGAHRNI